MVQSVPEFFIDDERICVTVMNGKYDLLKLNPRYERYIDLTEYLVKDEKYAIDIARNLGVTVFQHHWDLNFDQFKRLIEDLNEIVVKNEYAGKKTFVYF